MLLSDKDLEGKYWADDYRKWHAAESVSPELDKSFAGRLSSRDQKQKYDTAAELYTRSLFESLDGLQFEFQGELQGKTPDFLLRDQHGNCVVADVAVLHGGPMSEADKQEEDRLLLRRKVMDIKTCLFALEVLSVDGSRSVKGQGGGPVAFKKILHPVREWVRKQESHYHNNYHGLMNWQTLYDGSRSVSNTIRYEELGIDLKFTVDLYLKSEETEEQQKYRQYQYTGDIGVASSFMDNTAYRLESILKKKMSYLEDFSLSQPDKGSLPYIIIVFSADSFTPDRDSIGRVLYGLSAGYELSINPLAHEKLRQWEQRARQELHSYSEGLFTSENKDLLAVLVCQGHIAFSESCEMSMWINPYSSLFSIPHSLFQMKTYTLDRRIACTPPA